MNRSASQRPSRLTWRVYSSRDGREIDLQLRTGRSLCCCPRCGEVLEARPETRLARSLPLDATGYDLDCRACRRFRCVVRHTPRSLRLLRMRRFAAAVRAVDPGIEAPAAAADPVLPR